MDDTDWAKKTLCFLESSLGRRKKNVCSLWSCQNEELECSANFRLEYALALKIHERWKKSAFFKIIIS